MTRDNHDKAYGPDGPEVEPTLLLRYLIEKAEELFDKRYTGFPLFFRALGVSALSAFPELKNEFVEIVSPSEDSVNERAKKCKKLFVEALARPQNRYSYESSGESHEQSSNDRVIPIRFAWAARREGETMVERNNFEYLPIWECMTFIALQGDAGRLREFEEKCLQYPDPKQKIEQVIPILWDALRVNMRKKFRATTIDYSRTTTQRSAHSIIDTET